MDASDLASTAQIKKFKTIAMEDEKDGLGNLPEAVLSHILSFLPTKDAVRTSVLSTNWRYKWTLVPNLYFDDRLIYSGNKKNSRKASFMKFVERVLLLGNLTIQNFSLSCSKEKYDASRINAWISAVIRRDVRKLNIKCKIKCLDVESFVFPDFIYNCDSLAELKLQMICTFKVPPSIRFSSLKILELQSVTFLNEHLRELHFSFPVLEVLGLQSCQFLKIKIVYIDAPALNSFTWNYHGFYRNHDCVLKMCVPSLTTFSCGGFLYPDIILVGSSSVINANIDISNHLNNLESKHKLGLRTCSLLEQFSSARNLTVSSQTIWDLALVEDLQNHLPTFDNLIQLTMSGKGLPGMAILRCSPILESLIFPYSWEPKKDELMGGMVSNCFLTHLKLVEFKHFVGREDELELVKFLLKNAKTLEKMTITFSRRRYSYIKAARKVAKKQLSAFPMSSSRGSIVFC